VKYLVDSDWLIDATIGLPIAVRTLDRLTGDGLAISIIAVAEVYEGAFATPGPGQILVDFREFHP
jgi:tRNA(fMet)-specific endonuclease VapC